jgi:hypothetical protein
MQQIEPLLAGEHMFRKCREVFWLLSIMLIVCDIFLGSLRTCADDTPIVVLREDDARTTWRVPYAGLGGVSGLEYGKLKHIPITWAVITSATTAGGPYALSWTEIKDYLDTAGGEAASHSVTHSPLPNANAYINELINSKSLIELNLPGYACTTFLQPGTWTGYAYMDEFSELDNEVGQAIQSHYAQSMAYLGGGWMIGNPFYKYGLSNSYNVDYQSTPSIEAIDVTLDVVAGTPGIIFVISCHGIQETGGTQDYHVPADIMKFLMDKLAALRDLGKIRVVGLGEAFHNCFSSGLNLVPDSGFEYCNPRPANPSGPWICDGDSQIKEHGGIDNSKYASVVETGTGLKGGPLVLPPGRYELSWYQKPEIGYPTKSWLLIYFSRAINYSAYSNSDPNNWEKKTALLSVDACSPIRTIIMQPETGFGFCIDNVSLKTAPLDPAVSPTNTMVLPHGTMCKVFWDTPNAQDVSSIIVCYSSSTHPLTPSQGILLGTIPAIPGHHQEVELGPIIWSSKYVFFSIFAVKENGDYSPPDITAITVDRTVPSAPSLEVGVQDRDCVYANWSVNNQSPSICGYAYSVGLNPGGCDIRDWIHTEETSVLIDGLVAGQSYFVNVKAQSVFNYWSVQSSAGIFLETELGRALLAGDGTMINISGSISGVFSDCCYLEQADNWRGIKVIGDISSFHLDDKVSITGTLTTTESGERALIVQDNN